MELTLNKLPVNAQAIIISNTNTHLQYLGFVANAKIRIVSKAPFGGPIAVRISDDTFALRQIEAQQIYVELLQ